MIIKIISILLTAMLLSACNKLEETNSSSLESTQNVLEKSNTPNSHTIQNDSILQINFHDIILILGLLITIIIIVTSIIGFIGQSKTDERLEIWLNYWKFIFGTVIVGLIGTLINWQIQQAEIIHDDNQKKRELAIAETEQENKNLNDYVIYALDKNLEKRRALAYYFIHLTKNEKTKNRWRDYAAFVKTELDSEENRLKDFQDIKEEEDTRVANLEQKIDELKLNEEGNKIEIRELQSKLLKAETDAKLARDSISKIQNKISGTNKLTLVDIPPDEIESIKSDWNLIGISIIGITLQKNGNYTITGMEVPSLIFGDETEDIVRKFWKPDGNNINTDNQNKIKQFFKDNGIENESITFFIRSSKYSKLRVKIIQDLDIKSQ